jgi:MFS transporter, DHA2 family, multidrug resistance protein
VLAVIFSLKRVAEEGPGPLAGFVMLGGIGAGLVFIRRQQILADPLVDLSLFRAPGFSAALAINLLSIFVAFGPFVLIAQYLQLVLGLTPLQAGLWIVPSAIGNVVGSMVAPMLVRWMKPASVITAGLGVAAVGLIVLSRATPESGLLPMVVGSVILALGLTPPIIISTDMIVSAAPSERAGSAAALSETGAELGGALGIAILGTIGTAIYRGAITTTVPAAVPEAEALAARQTLGGALAAGHQLPQEIGDTLIMVAREAFSETMEITALISAVMLFATAIFAAVALRNVASAQEARSD